MSERCPFTASVTGSIELETSENYSYVPQACVGCLESPLRDAPDQIPEEFLEELEDDCMDFFADSAQYGSTFRWVRNEDGTITVSRESHQTWIRDGEEVSTEYHSRRTARIVCEKEVQLALWVDEC